MSVAETKSAAKRHQFKLVAKLPDRVPYLKAAQATQVSLHRDVELRILPGGSSDEHTKLYWRELKDLSRLDHPSFLPVHASLTLSGRPCYAVPMRRHPTLAELVRRKTFTLEARGECLRSLATALAAAHVAETTLGPIPAERIAWDADAKVAYYLHHKLTTSDWRSDWVRHTPIKGKPADFGEIDDVFCWGLLAFWVMTYGQHPYGAGPDDLRPLRRLEPGVAPGLSNVIEASLAWDRKLRPEWGPELASVLQADRNNLSKKDDPPPPDILNLGLASRAVLGKVEELRSTGMLQVPEAPRAPQEAKAGTNEALRDDGELVGKMTAPKDWRLEAAKHGFSLRAEETPAAQRDAGAYLAFMLLGVVIGVAGTKFSDALPRSNPPVIRTNLDPALKKLLRGKDSVDTYRFPELFKSLQALVLAKKLPEGHNNSRRLMALWTEYEKDPGPACIELAEWIRELEAEIEK